MREVMGQLVGWWREGRTVGMATVVGTSRSTPRPAGAVMLVGPDGEAVGSVSGGCVEGAVYDVARETMVTGVPSLQRYGFSDDDAWAVGLTCGGILDIFVERVDRLRFPELGEVVDEIDADRSLAVCTVIDHPDPGGVGRHLVVQADGEFIGTLGSAAADAAAATDVVGMIDTGRTGIVSYGPDGERRGEQVRVFVAVHSTQPRMLVFGAIDFAAAVCSLGSFLGYRVTVCDARPVFATASRFRDADEVVVDWPHRYLAAEAAAGRLDSRTVIIALTHDPKFDVPLLKVALDLPAVGYIGAMGSRRTDEDRRRRLLEAGVLEHRVEQLASPLGLDLGGRTPEETAVSIAAEIIALRWRGSGVRLAEREGPIHLASS